MKIIRGGGGLRYENEMLEIIRTAGEKAKFFGHSYVGSAHLLLALLQEKSMAGQILRSFGL